MNSKSNSAKIKLNELLDRKINILPTTFYSYQSHFKILNLLVKYRDTNGYGNDETLVMHIWIQI